MESHWSADRAAEAELGKFIDANFYGKLPSDIFSYNRFSDINDPVAHEKQIKGIDVELKDIKAGQKYLIDEKTSFYYSNLMIPTFAFEISFLDHDRKLQLGWFVKDDLETTHYLCIWPNVKCFQSQKYKNIWNRINVKTLQQNDFTIVEAMLINKATLKDYLNGLGYSTEFLVQKASELRRQKSDTNRIELNGSRLMYSVSLAEKPINLVVQKEALKSLAEGIYYISNDGFAKIKDGEGI